MENVRTPFQGIWNVIRFNWPFYFFSLGILMILVFLLLVVNGHLQTLAIIIISVVLMVILFSLLTTFYIYDLSGLYRLKWLEEIKLFPGSKAINLHAGFDETSALLAGKFPDVEFTVFNFYDALKHKEPSIGRARKAFPDHPGTINLQSFKLPVKNNYADVIFIILAAHEIRKDSERVMFFKELYSKLKPDGIVIIAEHLRDPLNFLAYNIGFFHFLSLITWLDTFSKASFAIRQKLKITPFITIFILTKG